MGAFWAQDPASGRGVISVGGYNNTVLVAHNATTSTGSAPIPYFNFRHFPNVTLPVFAFTNDPSVTNDGCVLPSPPPNLSGKVVVLRQSTADGCGVLGQTRSVYRAGASAVLIVPVGDNEPFYDGFPINQAWVTYQDGNVLLNQFAEGLAVNLTFGYRPAPYPNRWGGGQLLYASEIGPTWDMYMSTQVSSVGTAVLAVAPFNTNAGYYNYSVVAGTSFSAPLAAGAAALVLQSRRSPLTKPAQVREALQLSTAPIPSSFDYSTFATVAAGGAGKIGVDGAVFADLRVRPTELNLNGTGKPFAGQQSISLTNAGNSYRTYTLKHVPAATVNTINPATNQSYQLDSQTALPVIPNVASVSFSQTSVGLWPGQSATVQATFTPPSGADPASFSLYSGFVQIAGGDYPYQIPYLGMAADMFNHPVLDNTGNSVAAGGTLLPTTVDGNFNEITAGEVLNLQGTAIPTVAYRFAGGTRYFQLDLVSSSAQLGFTPNFNSRRSLDHLVEMAERDLSARDGAATAHMHSYQKKDLLGDLRNWWCQITGNKGLGCPVKNNQAPPPPTPVNTFAQVPIVGTLLNGSYIGRSNSDEYAGVSYYTLGAPNPTFQNGTAVPNGAYSCEPLKRVLIEHSR